MVAGHLREKNGYYHMILNWKGADGKRKYKSISTGLPVKGNLRKANAMLQEIRTNFIPDDIATNKDQLYSRFLDDWLLVISKTIDKNTFASYAHYVKMYLIPHFSNLNLTISSLKSSDIKEYISNLEDDKYTQKLTVLEVYEVIQKSLDYACSKNLISENPAKNLDWLSNRSTMLFTDYLLEWLEIMKPYIEKTTLAAYICNIKKRIVPFFLPKKYTLAQIEKNPQYIQDYYQYELGLGLSPNTVLRRHANIRKALQFAVINGWILSNPADRIPKPKKQLYVADYYKQSELLKLFEISKGDPLELPIILAAFYGLRRSEIVGLKWDSIDFENKSITIRSTVTLADLQDGNGVLTVYRDKLKNTSSFRTLPLVEPFEKLLVQVYEQQQQNRVLYGNSYSTDYLEFICVNQLGERIKPGFITQHFGTLLKKNHLRKIRFHDLRHSCASLLLAYGVNMKQIQAWLGHSDMATTANIYTHLSYNDKINSANAILPILENKNSSQM